MGGSNDHDAVVGNRRGGGVDLHDLEHRFGDVVVNALCGEERDLVFADGLAEAGRDRPELAVLERDDGDAQAALMFDGISDELLQDVGLAGAGGGLEKDPLQVGGPGECVAQLPDRHFGNGSVLRCGASVVNG